MPQNPILIVKAPILSPYSNPRILEPFLKEPYSNYSGPYITTMLLATPSTLPEAFLFLHCSSHLSSEHQRHLSFSVWFLVGMGEWIVGTISGDYIGATIGIHSHIPTENQTVLAPFAVVMALHGRKKQKRPSVQSQTAEMRN